MNGNAPLWDDLFRRAHAERERKLGARTVIERDALPVEHTPFGRVRWYLHPEVEDAADRALYFFELELPPRSRSGRLRHQGGIVHLVVEGTGHTLLNDSRHHWEELDVIAVPPREEGVLLQHVNDTDAPARLLVAFPNYDSALGPELGVAMEVVEPCTH